MTSERIIKQTTELVAAYVANNHIAPIAVPSIIREVYQALNDLYTKCDCNDEGATLPSSAEIAASVKYDRIISFIDGKPMKSLKRHLTAHGLTPEGYRARYGLPANYPMVAPSYAAQRSKIAKAGWLGSKTS